jgi:hypothetical protein
MVINTKLNKIMTYNYIFYNNKFICIVNIRYLLYGNLYRKYLICNRQQTSLPAKWVA